MATQDPLFPELPEDLTALSDEDLATLLQEHEVASELIDSDDEEFTKGMEADQILEAYEKGVEQIEAIQAEQQARVEAQKAYAERKVELAERRKAKMAEDAEEEQAEETTDEPVVEEAEVLAADEDSGDEDEKAEDDEKDKVDEEAVVVAAADKQKQREQMQVRLRRPPAPSADRMPAGSPQAMLTAAAGVEGFRGGQPMGRMDVAEAYKLTAQRHGRVSKHDGGSEQRILVATASYPIPEERWLHRSDWEYNAKKIADVVPDSIPGVPGNKALTASGGLCAPLEPIYSMPNFASTARPVRDALPSFAAERGGVNTPEATVIGDITTAITTITEANDTLGGTYATKSCQDLVCPSYTEVAVTVISHCREYGNLNSMAWPEKIAHENDLTMAAHARVAEGYLLDRIKALSISTTNGAETLSAVSYLVDGIVKAGWGIRGRLRMERTARLRVLLPDVLPSFLALDVVQGIDGNRFTTQGELVNYLRSFYIEPSFYMDTPSTGVTQLPDSAQTAAALDGLPDKIQWAIFPEGAFIHVNMPNLELGIVRDSTLNSTNDYQFFGESFENVARIGPAQSCLWVESDICPNGLFPPAGTARTCE